MRLLAVFGLVALIDYIPDRQLDATDYVIRETGDAAVSVWNWGERQLNYLTP